MIPGWWIEILPKSDQEEIKNTLNEKQAQKMKSFMESSNADKKLHCSWLKASKLKFR